MLSFLKAVFRLEGKTPGNSGMYYLGEGFGRGQDCAMTVAFKPDSNGKVYRFFRLIEEGENKGKYQPILVTRLGPTSEKMKRSEEQDILESGFAIYAMNSSKDALETYRLPKELITRQ